jgi:hypothetical protein
MPSNPQLPSRKAVPERSPNWAAIYGKLASIFPNASLGFGELGTANPKNGRPKLGIMGVPFDASGRTGR